MKTQFKNLLVRYQELSNQLADYTTMFEDSIDYDIKGYQNECDNDDYSNIEWLQNQVNAFESILKGFEMKQYIF